MSQYIHAFDASNKRVKPVAVDTDGHLQVDVVSMTGGGDATAAHQVTGHGKLDTIAGKLDTLDGSVNTIEGCVSTGELAVSHSGLTELAGAINSSKVDVNIASDGASLATSANQSTANGYLANVNSATYLDNDTPSISGRGMGAMAVNPSGKTTFLQASSGGDLHVEISDFVKGQATMASSLPVAIASNQSSLGVTHGAFTEIEGAINSSKMDINIKSDDAGLATESTLSNMDSNLSNLDSNIDVSLSSVATETTLQAVSAELNSIKPDMSQANPHAGASIASGSNTSEIDMNGYNHLTIYGSSSVNFGSLCLVRRSTSAGTDYLDGSNMVSANDPTGGSNYHFAATFENVGARYIAFRNVDSSSQTITLFVERSR